MNTIDIPIGSTSAEVKELFSYSKANAVAKLKLTDLVSHSFNQTLQRDGFWGAWADAYQVDGNKNGPYRVKITSPTHDVAPYGKLIPQYLKAGRIALEIYKEKDVHGTNFQFLLPFGLALANIQSVQLYHFPPTETFSYLDYLYSPTNRRWECLLAQNDYNGQNNAAVERIIDVVPVAAGGGDAKGIAPYNEAFIPYGKAQFKTFLSDHGGYTQPVVAMGGPVRDWLWMAYKKQIAQKLKVSVKQEETPLRVLSLLELEIIKGAKTCVLCANHPSMYLYDTDIPLKDAAKPVEGKYPSPLSVMRDDLVAAGWQMAMAKKWNANASSVLKARQKRWASDMDVISVIKEQNTEFSYASSAPTQKSLAKVNLTRINEHE